MKLIRRIVPLLTVVFFLSGCGKGGGSDLNQAMDFRTRLLGAAGCSFSAEITADYGDRRYTFSTDCNCDKDGNVRFEVTAPESIAGIEGSVQADGGKLCFDDTALDFGILADDQVSPMTCTYMMLRTWRNGYISSAGETEDGLRISFDSSYEENPLVVDLWLDEAKTPKYGEISYGGLRILSVSFENFIFLSDSGAE